MGKNGVDRKLLLERISELTGECNRLEAKIVKLRTALADAEAVNRLALSVLRKYGLLETTPEQ